MKKFGIKRWFYVLLFSFFLLGWRQETIYAAVSVPDFPTLAIDDSLITPVGQAGFATRRVRIQLCSDQ